MSMHRGLLGQTEGGASVKEECCGNPLRGCENCPPNKYVSNPLGFKDATLGDYIHRKQKAAAFDAVAQEKKLVADAASKISFEDWLEQYYPLFERQDGFEKTWQYEMMKAAFQAGKENA